MSETSDADAYHQLNEADQLLLQLTANLILRRGHRRAARINHRSVATLCQSLASNPNTMNSLREIGLEALEKAYKRYFKLAIDLDRINQLPQEASPDITEVDFRTTLNRIHAITKIHRNPNFPGSL